MKLVTTGLLVLALAVVLVPFTMAQEYTGGMGTNWVSSAMTIPPGAAMFNFHGRVWFGSMGDNKNLKNGSSAFNLNFGYTRKIEFGISQIVYQDYNWGTPVFGTVEEKYIAPGDLSLRVKFGNLNTTLGEYYLINAFTFGLRYRISKMSNIGFHPYFSSGMSPSVTWSGSWYSRPLYPDESQFLGVQLTYINHNDQNNSLTESAQSFQYGCAYTYPMKNLEVGAQVHGMFFVKTPSRVAFSREPYAYFAPIVNIHLYEGLQLMLSPEVLVSSAKNTTVNSFQPKGAENYTPWQLSGIIRYMPSTPFYSSDPFAKAGQGRRGAGAAALRERLNRESGNSLFDWTVDSERDLQFLNLDLEKTRIERQRAEEELLKLKKDLGK